MVLGEHGKTVLRPMTLAQHFYSFPWKRFYNNSLYFKSVCGVAAVVGSFWAYAIVRGEHFCQLIVYLFVKDCLVMGFFFVCLKVSMCRSLRTRLCTTVSATSSPMIWIMPATQSNTTRSTKPAPPYRSFS
jgi:hypothetical protein